ncbi:hypothetical protein [Methanosarcina sp.]|uniref:hypothetical protein n=1 Tax=Methanosarcina sp. TaxID=2213 RepID=UPI003C72C63C
MAFVAFLFLTVVIVVLAILLSYFILLPFVYDSNQNCTLVNMTSFVNQNSSDFVSIFVNTMLTLGLIIFSALSLSSAQDALKQSEKQQKQLQDEQRIRDIEKRLEFFYIPAEDIINGKLKKNREQTINGWPPANYIGLKDLRKYSYLADKETYKAYETYIESNCRETKEITCQDKYSNKPKGFTVCEDYKSGCHYQYDKCPQNLDYCKHYSECPPKDQSGIIQDNTKCKYYVDLKKKIAKDIEDYKKELLNLKK